MASWQGRQLTRSCAAHCHEVHPGGFVSSAGPVEIGEFADVVNLEVRPGVAGLAALGEEPVDQLVASGAGQHR